MICYDFFRHLYIYLSFLLLPLCLSPPSLSRACPLIFPCLNKMTCTNSLSISLPPCALTKVMFYFLGFCSNPACVLFNGFQDKLWFVPTFVFRMRDVHHFQKERMLYLREIFFINSIQYYTITQNIYSV